MLDKALLTTLSHLVSEQRNNNTFDLDQLSALAIVTKINNEDKHVARAVEKELPHIARAVELIVNAFNRQGRLIYFGAGTSGRLGVLDASECPPTFSTDSSKVVGIIAGGDKALRTSIEGAEDDYEAGIQDLKQCHLNERDVAVGIAVSGRTPYVIGGLNYANQIGAKTVALSCNPNSEIAKLATVAISPIVGAEVLSGSTRLKSGTAQKMVLNMLTTASMVLIGKSYQNLMVDVKASNKKLLARAVQIVMQATHCSAEKAEQRLQQANNEVKLAILLELTNLAPEQARELLKQQAGFLTQAIQAAHTKPQ